MITFFESFDTLIEPQGLRGLNLNVWDWDQFSSIGTLNTPFQMRQGYRMGRSLFMGALGGFFDSYWRGRGGGANGVIRQGVRFTRTSSIRSKSSWFIVAAGDKQVHFTLDVDGVMDIYLASVATSHGWNTGTLVQSNVMTVPEGGWNDYEFFVDGVTGRIEVWFNNTRLFQGNSTHRATGSYFFVIGAEHVYNVSTTFGIDLIWSTTGERLTTQGVQAVQVKGNWEGYTFLASSPNGRGSLIFSNERYQSGPLNTYLSTQYTQNVESNAYGLNVSNANNFLWDRDPRDGTRWSDQKVDEVTGFGICFDERGDGSQEVRLQSVFLEALTVSPGGRLKVVTYRPGETDSLSGKWRKTFPKLTFGAHVGNIPRHQPSSGLSEDTKSLYTPGGCLMFRKGEPFDPEGELPPEDWDIFDKIGLTFGQMDDEGHRDFRRIDTFGQAYKSYFNSGYSVLGQGNRRFQDNYITIQHEYLPSAGAYIQGIWDYALSRDTGRWSMRQQIYGPRNSFDHLYGARKLRMRGNGLALQVRVESEGDKPFCLTGWTMRVSGNANV